MRAPDWLEPMLKAWARAWLAMQAGGDEPLPSVLGRLKSQREAAGESGGPARQHFPEVFRGDALAVARVLHGAPWEVREVIGAHYLLPRPPDGPTIRERAEALDLARTEYFERLRSAEWYVAGRLEQHELEAEQRRAAREPEAPREQAHKPSFHVKQSGRGRR